MGHPRRHKWYKPKFIYQNIYISEHIRVVSADLLPVHLHQSVESRDVEVNFVTTRKTHGIEYTEHILLRLQAHANQRVS